jgi:hypothetical protein
MKVNLDTALFQINGKPFNKDDNSGVATLHDVLLKAALFERQEEKLTPEIKFKRYQLAQKISVGKGEIDLSPEDVVVLKHNAAYAFLIDAYGAIVTAIEGHKENVMPIK